jgi:hypothetical protein
MVDQRQLGGPGIADVVHRPGDLARRIAHRFGQHRVVFYQEQVHGYASFGSLLLWGLGLMPWPAFPMH